MTVRDAERQLREAQIEHERLQQVVILKEAKARRQARRAEKEDLKESAKVFEGLGLSPAGAKAAAKGRPESRF